jgi:hypothetical protein
MALVLSARDSKQQPKVGTSGALEIDGKKGTKGTQIYAFFAPSLFSAYQELIWNVWRVRRGSNPRPLP